MKTKTLGWIAALGITTSVFGFAACSQPPTECQVGLASTGYSYVAKYKLKTQPKAECMGLVRPGETFAMEFYHPATSDKSTYDSTKTTFALESDDTGNAVATYESVGGGDPCSPGIPCASDDVCGDGLKCNGGYCTAKECTGLHTPYGLGSFTQPTPDENDMCSVPTPSAAEEDLVEVVDTEGGGSADQACTTDLDCVVLAAGEAYGVGDDGITCESNDDCDIVLGPIVGVGATTCGANKKCVDAASGTFCDKTAGKCIVGCHGLEGMDPSATGCVAPFSCTSADETPGECKLPALSTKYAWKNLQFYVTASAPGTQFSGDLTYTEGDCTIEYTAVGLWPAIQCGSDADCNPCADPDAGTTVGSGINPDFPTKCDMDVGYCVLTDAKDPTKDADKIPQILATSKDCGKVE
jgi:hypothetical protein